LFENHLALITGAGRGIGRAIALHFARLGADIVVNYLRHRTAAEATVADIQALGRKAWAVKADIGKLEGLESLFAETERYTLEAGLPSGLDFLIHNAASGFNHPAMQQTPKGWEWTLNINARSLLFMAQRAVPLMEQRGGGAIVSLTSPGSTRVLPDYVAVGASKAALEALTRYLAVEFAPKNISVNAVSPGMVLTDGLKHFNTVRSEEGMVARAVSLTPARRMVTPEDVAELVAFLCSPAARLICGQTILIDGGFTLPAG
jgi:enoyl-[acyl-carrier protein] reductase III